jgi:hypothetical protein
MREVIARLMQEFSAQGAVSTKRGVILVIDAEKLASVITTK